MQVGAAASLLICCIISAHHRLFSWLKRSVKATQAAVLSHEFIRRARENKGAHNFHMHNEDSPADARLPLGLIKNVNEAND